ncbi:translocation and assembly module TamB [Alteromonadaceae bacterium Bs31]|nr:translocation and assembly module TamB [Alteromonadaceae bacterium Bs31]
MLMRIAKAGRWLFMGMLFFGLLTSSFVFWLLGTRAGAGWALAMAEPYIPVSISYQKLRGNLWQGLAINSLEIKAKEIDLGFSRISASELRFAWSPAALLSQHVSVSQLEGQGVNIHLSSPKSETDSAIKLPRFHSPVDITVNRLSFTEGKIWSNSEQSSKLPDIELALQVNGNLLHLKALAIDYQDEHYKGEAQFEFGTRLAFKLKETSHGSISLNGHCNEQGQLSCDAELQWAHFSHHITGELGIPSGKFTLSYDDLKLSAEGENRLNYQHKDLNISSSTSLDFKNKKLSIQDITAPMNNGALSLSGELNWSDKLNLEVQAKASEISLAEWLPEKLNQSKISFTSHIKAAFNDNNYSANIQTKIQGLTLGKQPLSGDVLVKIDNSNLQVDKLTLQNESAKLNLDGSYSFQDQTLLTNLDFIISKSENIFPNSKGSLEATVKLDGRATSPNADLYIHSKEFSSPYFSSQNLSFKVDIDATQVSSDTTTAYQLADSLRITTLNLQAEEALWGEYKVEQLSLNLSGDLKNHAFYLSGNLQQAGVRLETLALTGGLDIKPQAKRIDWSSSNWKGELADLSFQIPALSNTAVALESPAPLELSLEKNQLKDLCLKQALAYLCINNLSLNEKTRFELEAKLGGVYLDNEKTVFTQLQEQLPEDWTVKGELHAELLAQGSLAADFTKVEQLALSSRVAAEGLAFQYRDTNSELIEDFQFNELWLNLSGDENDLKPTGKILFDNEQSFALNGHIKKWQSAERNIAVKLYGELDKLKYFQAFFPSIQSLDGRLRANIQYLQNIKEPKALVVGSIKLDKFSLLIPAYGTEVANWSLGIDATKNNISLSGSGNIGKGEATINGSVTATTETERSQGKPPFAVEAMIKGEKLSLVNLPDTRLTASPNLNLTGNGLLWHLAGNLRVSDSYLKLVELPASAIRVSEDSHVYGITEQRQSPFSFTSDVQLVAAENIRFEGFGLSTDIEGRVHFTRDNSRVNQLQGGLSLPEGEFKAYGQTLEIENGQIYFSGPVNNPALDVRAARRIDSVSAGIWLHGTARRPESSLYSTPSMSEADILSYMITGRPMSQSNSSESSHMEAAALAMGLRQALPALQKIGSQFGLSDISVEAGPAGGGGSIAAGKRLNDKLFVKYQYGLVGAVGRFVIEYQLTQRLKMEAGSGETDTIDLTYTWDSTPPESTTQSEGESESTKQP